jgi:hypothetical protein
MSNGREFGWVHNHFLFNTALLLANARELGSYKIPFR